MINKSKVKNYYDSLDRLSKEAKYGKQYGPLEPEYYDGRERAFELAKELLETWLDYTPEIKQQKIAS